MFGVTAMTERSMALAALMTVVWAERTPNSQCQGAECWPGNERCGGSFPNAPTFHLMDQARRRCNRAMPWPP